MKKAIAKAAVLIMVSFVVLPAAMPSETLMRANIPFAYLAGDQMQPAGEYWVRVNSNFRYLELRPLNSATAIRVSLNGDLVSRAGTDKSKGLLRFERYGSTYALRAVATPGAEEGLGMKPFKAEKEAAKANCGGTGVEISLTQ